MKVKPLPGIKVDDETFTNIHEWKLVMDGPPNTPYAVLFSPSPLALSSNSPRHILTI